MRVTRSACLRLVGAALAVVATSRSAAAATAEDVPIVGGTTSFAAAVGINPAPEASRFVAEVARLVYDVAEGSSDAADAKIERLVRHLETVATFQEALVAAQAADGTLTIGDAGQKARRERLGRLFDLIGLRLREKKRVYSVERVNSRDAAARVAILKALGIDLDHLQTELNAGHAVLVTVPAERVPVPLTTQFWDTTIFQRPVPARELVPALLRDHEAALLARGLAGLDDPTLEYLQSHPAIVRNLYEHDASVFAAFSDSLRIHEGVVVPPGGGAAVPLWEAVVGETVTRPDRFIRELFSQRDGRLAYLYSTIDHLDADRRAFALSLGIRDSGIRLDRFKALADIASSSCPEWHVRLRPFGRAPHDLAMLLSGVRIDHGGSLAQPRARGFWSRVFGDTVLQAPGSLLKNLHEDGDVDVAWLASQVIGGTAQERRLRFAQFAFAQRAFAGTEDARLPDALVAARAYARFPALALALERMQVRDPAVYVAAARHADRLGALDNNRGFVALSEFQGAIALLVRLVRAGSLSPDRAESLAAGLTRVHLDDDGWYRRGVAQWMRRDLGQALGVGAATFDDDLLTALSGPSPAVVPIVQVEGHRYRVSIAAAERRRLERFRQETSRPPLEALFALDAIADSLASPTVTQADVQEAARRLKAVSAPLPSKTMPLGVDVPRAGSQTIADAVKNLAKITKPKDLKKAAAIAGTLGPVVDAWLGDELRSLVYALHLGDPGEQFGADVSRRHDFGFVALPGDERDRTPWSVPEQRLEPGAPFHLRGSLLALDVPTASLMLKHVSKQHVSAPSTLLDLDRGTFVLTPVLMNARDLRDEDRDAIAAAIDRGRERVKALSIATATAQLAAMRDEVGLDGWRSRAVLWSLTHDGDPLTFFSLVELLQLGDPRGVERLDAWGISAWQSDTCLCTHTDLPNRWLLLSGRPQLGVIATQAGDLPLRIAVALRDLSLPAVLARDVLFAATADFVDEVAPTDSDDWLTLVRAAQQWSQARIEDYIAALSAGGPLLPVEGPQQAGR